MAQREGGQPLLDQHAGLVGHPWWTPLPRPHDLRAVAVELVL
jgi:hypothetical protein